ncbi:hypothetical protein LguiA_021821 [Lonicera macranthoides]
MTFAWQPANHLTHERQGTEHDKKCGRPPIASSAGGVELSTSKALCSKGRLEVRDPLLSLRNPSHHPKFVNTCRKVDRLTHTRKDEVGRFGRKGVAINFVTQEDERMLFDILVVEELLAYVTDLLLTGFFFGLILCEREPSQVEQLQQPINNTQTFPTQVDIASGAFVNFSLLESAHFRQYSCKNLALSNLQAIMKKETTPLASRSISTSSHHPNNSDNNWDGRPYPQFRNLSSQPSFISSQHYTRSRHNNIFSPLRDQHLLEENGDGEAWGNYLEDNPSENEEHITDSIVFYSLAGFGKFQAVHRPSSLNVNESVDWGNMADDEPFQSWEANADAEFNAALNKTETNNTCISLGQHISSSILNQTFPPHKSNQDHISKLNSAASQSHKGSLS